MPNWLRKIFGKPSDARPDSADKSPEEMYSFLRNQPLFMRRADFRIPGPPPGAPIWGLLMEWNHSGITATVLTLIDGTTSVYLSDGGAVIGGQGHEDIREANAEFIRTANQLYQHLKPCESFPSPAVGQTIFYALTDPGVLTAYGLEADLTEELHPLSPLFHVGHRVLGLLFQRGYES